MVYSYLEVLPNMEVIIVIISNIYLIPSVE